MSISLNINTSLIKQLFNQIVTTTVGLKKNKMINIRATFERVELSVQGAFMGGKAEVDGEGDIVLPAKVLKAYLDTCSTTNITFSFSKGELRCGSSIYQTSAIEIFPIGLRTHLEIPINPNRLSVLRYALSDKDAKQIALLGLTETVKKAKLGMKKDIEIAHEALEKYNITFDEIEQIVISRILIDKQESK
jgi:hypothetical protein